MFSKLILTLLIVGLITSQTTNASLLGGIADILRPILGLLGLGERVGESTTDDNTNLRFTYCGGESRIYSLRIRGCVASPCTFYRGQEYYGEMDFIPVVSTSTLPFNIRAIRGFPLPPVSIFSGDACENLADDRCPTTVGSPTTALLYMHIPTTLPTMSTNITVTFRDSTNVIQGCLRIPVNIL